MFRSLIFGCLSLAVLALVASACGGDDDSDDADGPTQTTTSANGNGDGQAVDVVMGDNFFDPEEFTVSPGETITFDLVNEGTNIHNMRIAGPDGDYQSEDDDVSDPDLVRGGETASLTWTAPDEAGEIVFRCDFHPVEMVGTITIQ